MHRRRTIFWLTTRGPIKTGHDEEAAFAAAQIANEISEDGRLCFANPRNIGAYAARVKRVWPIPDGLIRVQNDDLIYDVAVEYKRINEGVHGVLTAIGQALSYIASGFSGTMIVVPNSYSTLGEAGKYATEVLKKTCESSQIGVLSYDELDMSQTSPFDGKITQHKSLELDSAVCSSITSSGNKTSTQWGFVREGETTPDTIFKWLQTAREPSQSGFAINENLKNAVLRLDPTANPHKYLSNSPGSENHDELWRTFWFNHVLTKDMQKVWIKQDGRYQIGEINTDLKQFSGKARTMFGGRTDSIKNKLVEKLNSKEITEDDAWKEFAENIHRRAHSFRETIDSGLEAFGLIDNDGEPTYLGHQFIHAYKNDRHELVSIILQHALLKKGMYGALLHYIFRLSEDMFSKKPFSFYKGGKFQIYDYLGWLEDSLHNMHVLHKVSQRGGTRRQPLQAERSIMKQIGLVSGKMRPGVGIVINWPKVNEALDFDPQKTDL